MFDKLKQLSQLKAMQDQMKKEIFSAERDGIKITVNGNLQIEEVLISTEVNPDQLARAIKDCTNDALRKAQMGLAQKIQGMGLGF